MAERIKTYAHLHPHDPQLPFDLKRMAAIYEAAGGRVDAPHRHDYYTILLVRDAEGHHMIDFERYPFEPPCVFFVSPGQVHQVVERRKSSGHVITFSPDFLGQNHIRASFISDINLFRDYGQAPPLRLDAPLLATLQQLIEHMEAYLASPHTYTYEAVGACLKLFLINCHHACDLNDAAHTQVVQAGLSILRDFKSVVEAHITAEHKVAFYADRLAVTPDHLNKTVKSMIGKSAKEYLQSRLIVEAKRKLVFTDLSAKEIAYELGFKEPAHFSNFFKKCTRQSVSAFRAQQHP